ncbi:hypothetical protein EVAR_12471_1 [Eumeta japonica]|uniref:Uncharacterized protein n=1 Tax=Eumeta variegata TaxID=151549 RepID=A0A4C1TPJ5_EUMVA|nr:hypothetical protein EVAR_12471_1 [Eumeta japonica]
MFCGTSAAREIPSEYGILLSPQFNTEYHESAKEALPPSDIRAAARVRRGGVRAPVFKAQLAAHTRVNQSPPCSDISCAAPARRRNPNARRNIGCVTIRRRWRRRLQF